MKRLILVAALSALVVAKPKPETYKETEDFQYSRSSSDDGTKSGFYGAQRGNMGGNYERAHNMDNLAQHQMSGLVSQVDGELGDGAKTRTGSVYTAANSRGIYGSGNYDLSNLKGRNFAEGESIKDSLSHSSLSSQNSRFGSRSYSGMESSGFSSSHGHNSRYSGYHTSDADQSQTDNLQAVDMSQGSGRYENDNQAGHNIKYHTQYGSRGQNEFDQSRSNLYSSRGYDANSQSQYITTPVRVVMRPGGRVAIPISAPTYAVSQNILSDNKNAINTDAEVLNQQEGFTPTNKVKHYEASYSYRKQWEKHHEVPGNVLIPVPTENPFPKNSELYEDAQLLQSSKNQFQDGNSLLTHSSHTNNDHRAYTKSATSSRSRLQADENTQQGQSAFDSHQSHLGLSSQQSHSGLSSQQIHTGLSSQQIHTGLSSQQSHSGLSSQQSHSGLSSQQTHSGLSSQQSHSGLGSQQSHLGYEAQQGSASSNAYVNGNRRIAQVTGIPTDLRNNAEDVNLKPKSYRSSYSYHKSWERQGDPYVIKPVGGIYDSEASQRLTAASSNNAAYSHGYGSHSSQAHQSYSADCDQEGHIRVARSSNTDQKLENNQNEWEDVGQETQQKWENLEDLSQQQQSKWDNLQDLGQQTQINWDNLQQMGQETQNLQQLGQETQNTWDNLQELGQQTQDKWDNLEDFSQQTQKEPAQDQKENLEDFSQHSQQELFTNYEQQANNEDMDIFNQHSKKEDTLINYEQNTYTQNEKVDFTQHDEKDDSLIKVEQKSDEEHLLTPKNYNEHENLPSIWNQIPDFKPESHLPTNGDNVNQQVQPKYELNNMNWNGQSEQNPWNQEFESEKNLDSYDIIKPITQRNEDNEKNIQSGVYRHSLWQSNDFDNFKNHFEHNFPQDTFSTSNSGNPLQSLWDKIDNIGGEITVTNSKTEDRNIFSYDSTKFYSNSQDVTHTQNNDSSGSYMSDNTNIDLPNFKTETQIKESSGHHNLFDDALPNMDTEIPVMLPNHTPKSIDNAGTSINASNPYPFNSNKNKHSQDEGRGDIGPEETLLEITTPDKSHKTQQEIEALSLTKEAPIIIIPPSLVKNKEENNDDKKLFTSLNPQENTDDNRPYNLNTMQTTLPTIKSTEKSNTDDTQPNNASIDNILNLEKYDFSGLYHQTENKSIPETFEQQNFEQEHDDFGQLQSSWFPTNNIQDGYDQQNIEQQFEQFQLLENMQGQKDHSSKLSHSNSNQQNTIYDSQFKLFSTKEPQLTTTESITKLSTEVNGFYTEATNQADLNNNNSLDLQKQLTHQEKVENVAIPEDLQQDNFEQVNEDFGQLQSSWFPSNNLENIYDQQNREQQFEDFQQHENMQVQTYIQDLSKQMQTQSVVDVQNPDVQGNTQQLQDKKNVIPLNSYEKNQKTSELSKDTIKEKEELIAYVSVDDNAGVNAEDPPNTKLNSENISTVVETIAEKSGFWTTVGDKLTKAKNKVFSWFKNT